MKVYTYEELERFCKRAVESEEREKVGQAEEFIKSRPYLSKAQKSGLLDYIGFLLLMSSGSECEDWDDGGNPFTPDYLDRDSRDYGPSNPWDAPGMRVSDFITGVRMF